MNAAEHSLSLMAEAAAHGIEILFSNREIGLSTCRPSTSTPPAALLAELEAHANEIWAILYGYRARQPDVTP